MWRIELTGLLARIGGKVADEIFIDIPQHVIVLRPIGRDVLDKADEVFQRARLAGRILTQLAQSGLQRFEDAVINMLITVADEPVESIERRTEVCHIEVAVRLQPCREEVFIFDEIADVLFAIVNRHLRVLIVVVLHKELQHLLFLFLGGIGHIFEDIAHLVVGEKFVEDESKNIVLIFVGVNL